MFLYSVFQALDAAMKQYKSLSPETAAIFFSTDPEAGKILCMSCVPKVRRTNRLLDIVNIYYPLRNNMY